MLADHADRSVDDLAVGDGMRIGEHPETLYGRYHPAPAPR
jgi:hypothetical protein